MENPFFNIEDLDKEVSIEASEEDKSGILAEKYLSIHQHRVEAIKHLTGKIPQEGEVFFFMDRKFIQCLYVHSFYYQRMRSDP